MTDVIVSGDGVSVIGLTDSPVVVTTVDDPERPSVEAAVVSAATLGAETSASAQARSDKSYQDAVTYFESRTAEILASPSRPRWK